MNTRKDNNGRAMKKWLATPPGRIEKPLRFIRNRWSPLSHKYEEARLAAKRGDGQTVQNMARAVLAKEQS